MTTIYGMLTSQGPIVHGGIPEYGSKRKKGEALKFNRVSISFPIEVDGSTRFDICRVPVVTGNSTRGQTRRPFILKTLQILDPPQKSIHPEIIHFLAAGGGTGKDDTAVADQFKFKQEIRRMLPFVNLLGGSLRGMFLKGALIAGFVYPVVEETRWMLAETPFNYANDKFLTAEDLNTRLDILRMTRRKTDDDFLTYTETEEMLDDIEENVEGNGDEEEVNREKGAIYSAEALPAGIPLFTYFGIRCPDGIVEGALNAFVETFVEMGTLGGYVAKGCGRVSCNFVYEDGNPFNKDKAAKYWQYLRDHKDEIKQFLKEGLKEYLKSSDKLREEKKGKAKQKKGS